MQYARALRAAITTTLMTFAACADEHAPLAVNTGDGRLGIGSGVCEALDVERCSHHRGCELVYGHVVDERNECVGSSRPAACRQKLETRECNAAIGHARDPQGALWQFSDLCIPVGFASASGDYGEFDPCAELGAARDAATPTAVDASLPGPIDAGDPECTKRDLESCEQLSYCELIEAPLVDERRQCIGVPVAAACEKRWTESRICDDAYHLARDQRGRVFWFGGGCLPSSLQEVEYRSLEACGAGQPELPCESLDVMGCALRKDCAGVHGHRIDLTRRCIGGSATVACIDVRKGCNAAIGYTRDAEGTLWRLPSSSTHCQPASHERVSYDALPTDASSWMLCNPQPQQPNTHCSELSTTACESDPACRGIPGLQYDPVRKCRWEQPVIVGCTQADRACRPVVVYARYPGAQEAFEIASGCLPSKFEQVDEYPGDLRSWPVCK
jgi:hypothetical protein